MMNLEETLSEVTKLIESQRYKKIIHRLASANCERCYLGLVIQVLVDQGYFRWIEGDTGYNLRPGLTEKGLKAGYLSQRGTTLITCVPGFPNFIKVEGKGIVTASTLNDLYGYSFSQTHELVLKEAKESAKG